MVFRLREPAPGLFLRFWAERPRLPLARLAATVYTEAAAVLRSQVMPLLLLARMAVAADMMSRGRISLVRLRLFSSVAAAIEHFFGSLMGPKTGVKTCWATAACYVVMTNLSWFLVAAVTHFLFMFIADLIL